jgi:hypothetical protein
MRAGEAIARLTVYAGYSLPINKLAAGYRPTDYHPGGSTVDMGPSASVKLPVPTEPDFGQFEEYISEPISPTRRSQRSSPTGILHPHSPSVSHTSPPYQPQQQGMLMQQQ